MKKIFFLTFSLLVTAFLHQSCKPVDNTKAIMESDSIANARLVMLNDSLKMSCVADVMAAAKMRSDSMMMMMQSHGSSKGSKGKPPKAPVSEPSLSNRPGATNSKPGDN